MKVAVVGYGKMGREVQAVLEDRDHEAIVVPRGHPYPAGCPVGIDFTRPEAVIENVGAAMSAGSRYVVGTTGWNAHERELSALVDQAKSGLVHSSNFSLGVNLFFEVVRQAANVLAAFPDYDPYIVEKHHRHKRDAPSGTALVLAGVLEAVGRGAKHPRSRAVLSLEGPLPGDGFHVASVRGGGIVGEHTVGFDSGGDETLIEHRARSRRGFALGAVLAAEWIVTRTGVHTFSDVLATLRG